MADSKTYLSVPYSQKDEAKALGARWDAHNKKWYVPANKDLALFAKWHTESDTPGPGSEKPRTSASNTTIMNDNGSTGVFTYPADKNFVAYNGDEPPWN